MLFQYKLWLLDVPILTINVVLTGCYSNYYLNPVDVKSLFAKMYQYHSLISIVQVFTRRRFNKRKTEIEFPFHRNNALEKSSKDSFELIILISQYLSMQDDYDIF